MSEPGMRAQLIRGGAGSLAIGIASVGLGLIVAIVLARFLGPEGYGGYAYVFAMVSLMAIPSQFGLPNLVVRETAKAQANEEWGLMYGLWRWASAAAGAIAIMTALVALGIAWAFAEHFTELQLATFGFGLLLIPLIAFGNLRGAALRGLRRVVAGQLPDAVLRPGLLIALTLGAVLVRPSEPLTAAQAMGLHALAAAAAFAIGAWMLWRARPVPLRLAPAPVYQTRAWVAAALPLAFLTGMQMINSHMDILMLGIFRAAENVGIYRVAVQGATLVVFGLQAVNMVVAPHFARLHAAGDTMKLQQIVTLSARASLAMALPVALAFGFFGREILGLIFGLDYAGGRTALAILAVGQVVNAAMGSVGFLLNMTGHERDAARGVAIAAGCNITLNLILIPLLGMNGAAVATALTLVVWNSLLWRAARLRLGIDSSAFRLTRSDLSK